MRKAIITTCMLLLVSALAFGEDSLKVGEKIYRFIPVRSDTIVTNGSTYILKYIEEPNEAYIMRSNGKIYVVVTVLAIIFAGIFVYLILLNRKIGKLEKDKIN